MINHNHHRYESVADYAAKGNQLKTLKWLIKHDFGCSTSTVFYAGGKGHTNIVNFLVKNQRCQIDSDCSNYAASHNQFEIVKYFYSIDPSLIHGVCNDAIRSGNLDMLKFAYKNGSQIDVDDISCKDIRILNWLFDNIHIQPSIKISGCVAWAGNLECLQFLHRHKFPILNEKVFANAVSGRNIEMIKWLHDLGCPFDEDATNAAIQDADLKKKGGSLVILKLLIEWGCKMDWDICWTVAQSGDLEMLQYIHTLGYELNCDDISHAATHGHLHMIIWCREQGCVWDVNACRKTVMNNHLNVLRWLRGFDRDTCELKSNETEICPWNEKVCLDAIYYGNVDVLKFALENGCENGDDCFKATMTANNDDIFGCFEDYYSRLPVKADDKNKLT